MSLRLTELLFSLSNSPKCAIKVLLTTMMVLKKAFGPAILAGLAIIPTHIFSQTAKTRFLKPFTDAGLLQTSQLDGWATSRVSSTKRREEYRKWLVDCHKASFVPVCLAGITNSLTAEPAVVVPSRNDQELVRSED